MRSECIGELEVVRLLVWSLSGQACQQQEQWQMTSLLLIPSLSWFLLVHVFLAALSLLSASTDRHLFFPPSFSFQHSQRSKCAPSRNDGSLTIGKIMQSKPFSVLRFVFVSVHTPVFSPSFWNVILFSLAVLDLPLVLRSL